MGQAASAHRGAGGSVTAATAAKPTNRRAFTAALRRASPRSCSATSR
jgi:hypothetical protein